MKLPGVASRSAARKSSLKKGSSIPAPCADGVALPHLLPHCGLEEHKGTDSDGDEHNGNSIGRDDFDVLELLGQGGFGEVKLVQCNRNGQLYAMKAVEKRAVHERRYFGDDEAKRRAQAERDIGVMTRQWQCPFIIELCAAFQTGEKLYYIFEYCPQGDLYEQLVAQPSGRFAEATACFYVAEICLALEHLHMHDTIHRDVKLENVLIASDGHVKLADFGIAKANLPSQGARPSYAFGGTDGASMLYPPEFHRGELYGKDLDCWQLGVAAFLMLAGRLPQPGGVGAGLPQATSQAAGALCRGLLEEERQRRLGHPDGAIQLRGHAFFREVNWRALHAKAVEPPALCDPEAQSLRGSARPTVKTRGRVSDFFRLRNFSFIGSVFRRATSRRSSRASR